MLVAADLNLNLLILKLIVGRIFVSDAVYYISVELRLVKAKTQQRV
jgi:hypothetical protein